MSGMLQPDDVLNFGKHKGKTIKEVFERNPDYLCWMRKTGFDKFGREVTQALFDWEESNPTAVANIEWSIARKKKAAEKEINAAYQNPPQQNKVDEANCGVKDRSFVPPPPPPAVTKVANWGDW